MTTTIPKHEVASRVDDAVKARSVLDSTPAPTCVVIPDATRPLPVRPVLGPLLERLTESNSPTSVLVGLGLHRPMTDAELEPLRRVVDGLGVDIVQHDARGDEVVDLGRATHLPASAPRRLPVGLHRRIVDAERVICVGTVEPHQYAGFSGGIKAVSIGCAGESTISAMHGLDLLRDPKTTLGIIDDNPFQQTLWRIADDVDDVLGLQIVPATGGGIADVFFDSIDSGFRRACDVAQSLFFEDIDQPLDWLHLPVPSPKASNFYQASRAATYAALVDRPAIQTNGAIIIEANCPEKMGKGAGERACAEAMARGKEQLLEELHGTDDVETRGGQQRAYVLARACDRNRIALVGAPAIEALSPMGIDQFDTVEQAVKAMGLNPAGGRRIDDVFHGVPRLATAK